MNKKKVNYILIPVVLMIWGAIGYTIVAGLSDNDNTMGPTTVMPVVTGTTDSTLSFSIAANYRDPFLNGARRSYSGTSGTAASTPRKQVKKVEPKKEKPTVNWSFITYHGKIKNQSSGKNVGILNIHGQDYLVDEGQTIEEVQLIKVLEDSIKVLYQKEYAFIKKN